MQERLSALLCWLNENSGAVTAMAALVGVVITTVYTAVTGALWRTTKRQATLTREIFEATHRPHISIRPHLLTAAHPGHVRIDFELKNHGSSPGIVTAWVARLATRHTELATSGMSGTLCVFPGGTQNAPQLEVEGPPAGLLWQEQSIVTLDVRATYLGADPKTSYRTRVVAHALVTAAHTLILKDVQHEVE